MRAILRLTVMMICFRENRTMTRTRCFTRSLAMACWFVAGATMPVSAQTLATTTTLSAAVDKDDNTITVASATTFADGAKVWIDHELMIVLGSYGTGTTIPVRRGTNGTAAAAHPNAAKVTVAVESATSTYFYTFDPDFQESCTRGSGQAASLPWVNIRTGTTWICRTGNNWIGTNIAPIIYDSDQAYTP